MSWDDWGGDAPLTQPFPCGRGLGEGLVFRLNPLFPAQAGTQTLRHWREVARSPPPRHCEAQRAEATQGNIYSGPRQPPGLLRYTRNDAGRGGHQTALWLAHGNLSKSQKA